MRLRTLAAIASTLFATTAIAQRAELRLPADEVRAVAFLKREVPQWRIANDCYSCHNNGDAVRALLVAARRGHNVGTALDDTLAWLREPARWNHNKTTGGIDDKALARVQFASALRLAVDAGLAPIAALDNAAAMVAADQQDDGSWRLDTSQSLGSPTTYGTTLATTAVKRALSGSTRAEVKPRLAKADAWLRTASVDSVLDAAAVVLGLGLDGDAAAIAQRERALTTLKRGQAPSGGWGPYTTVNAEVFDTALVVLALSELRRQTGLAAPVYAKDDLLLAIARGAQFVEGTQLQDGSWPETTRPSNQESYAQRISTTGWALLALIESRRSTGVPAP